MIKLTPTMGWNSWNTLGTNINEQVIKEIADTMVETGLRDAGYEYLCIDDCWSEKERGTDGRLKEDSQKFPNGMKAVADYVHSKGLKFGMYTSSGHRMCMGAAASYDYEFEDVETFASWGADLLKYDFCDRPAALSAEYTYRRMGAALASCGRDILFSACSWGKEDTYKWIKTTGASMWRSTGDINDSWGSINDIYMQQLELQPYNGLGCFNDMDMLVVGMNGGGNVGVSGCTYEEYKTHFSLWAILNSPLMIGCDIRSMSEETKSILMNREVIAINQDPAGRQPFLLHGGHELYDLKAYIWAKLLNNGDFAIGMFNMEENASHMTFSAADLGFGRTSGRRLVLTDLWTGEEQPMLGGIEVAMSVEGHGCKMFRAKAVKD